MHRVVGACTYFQCTSLSCLHLFLGDRSMQYNVLFVKITSIFANKASYNNI